MIDSLSDKITQLTKDNLGDAIKGKEEIVNYGVSILLYDLIMVVIIFSLASFLGVIKYIAITVITYSSFRIAIGGAHSKSRIECAVISIAVLFGTVLISQHLKMSNYSLSVAIYIINLIIISIYAPGDTEEKPILSRRLKRRLKITSLAVMTFLFIAALIAWNFDIVIYNVIIICTLPAVFLLTPIGYRVLRCKHSNGEL